MRSAAATNLVVRRRIGDDLDRADRKAAVLGEDAFVAATVPIEGIRMPKGRGYFPGRATVAGLLGRMTAGNTTVFERAAAATGRYRAGADAADMIDPTPATDADGVVAVERQFAGRAGDRFPLPIEMRD